MAESSAVSSGYTAPALTPQGSPKTKSSSSVALRSHHGSTYSRSIHHNNVHNIRGRLSDVVKNAPILRRTDFGEYYPDGGWGWVVCGASFLVHFLCHGLHLAGGTIAEQTRATFQVSPVQTGIQATHA
jgi:hypothetical protein